MNPKPPSDHHEPPTAAEADLARAQPAEAPQPQAADAARAAGEPRPQPTDPNSGRATPQPTDPECGQSAPQPTDPKYGQSSPLKSDRERLLVELAAARDRELRLHAELENYRKRAARELEERLRYANLGLLRDLLPVLDNVDRAIEAAEKNADAAALREGFKMVHKQLGDALARHHCRPIDALNEPFDPHKHHALMQQPSADHPPHTVLAVTQAGYQLHDRVVRPSQVIVSKAE